MRKLCTISLCLLPLLMIAVCSADDCDKAREEFSVAREKSSGSEIASSQLEEVLSGYKKALELCPGMAEAQHNLAAVLLRLGRADEAEESYRKAIESSPNSSASKLGLGSALLAQEKSAEAVELYQELAKSEADNPSAFLGLSIAHSELGEFEEALDALSEGLRASPGNTALLYNRAALFERRGLTDEALELYRKVLAIDATHLQSQFRVALLNIKDKPEEAASALEDIVNRDPSKVDAWRALAQIAEKKGDFDEAEFHLRKVLRLADKRPVDSLNLSLVLLKKNQASLAYELLSGFESEQFGSQAKHYFRARATAQDQLGKSEAAREDLLRALEIDPADLESRAQLAGLYERLGQSDLAARERERIKALEAEKSI